MPPRDFARGLTQRTLRGIGWSSLGTLAQVVANLAVTVLLARLLSPEDFGVVAVGMVVISFCQVFTRLGVGPSIIQRAELGPAHVDTGVGLSLALSAGMWALVTLGAPVLAAFFRTPEAAPVMRALAPVLAIRGLGIVSEAQLMRELRFRSLAPIQAASYLLGFGGLGVGLAVGGAGAWALVAAQVAQAALETTILLIMQPIRRPPRLQPQAARELMSFGGGVTLGRLANYVSLQGDNVIVARWLGAEALGLYTRAYRLMAYPANLFGDAVDTVLFPAMAAVQKDSERLARAYRRGLFAISVATMPVSALLVVLAPEAVRVVLGPVWNGLVAPLQILAAGVFFRIGYKLSASLLRASGHVYRLAAFKWLHAGMLIGGAWLGRPYGLRGVAAGVTIALAVHFLVLTRAAVGRAGVAWRHVLSGIRPAVTISVVAGAATYVVAGALRSATVSEALVLLGGLAAFTLTAAVMHGVAPNLTLGEDGAWWVQTLRGTLPAAPGQANTSSRRGSQSDWSQL
jgi:PST family polysaccharide transporter